MCVVIRYFGGTKLGVGGLVKAYSNSCIEALNKATLIDYQVLDSYRLIVNYSDYDKLEYFLKNSNIQIENKTFEEKVSVIVKVNKKSLETIQDYFANLIKILKL